VVGFQIVAPCLRNSSQHSATVAFRFVSARAVSLSPVRSAMRAEAANRASSIERLSAAPSDRLTVRQAEAGRTRQVFCSVGISRRDRRLLCPIRKVPWSAHSMCRASEHLLMLPLMDKMHAHPGEALRTTGEAVSRSLARLFDSSFSVVRSGRGSHRVKALLFDCATKPASCRTGAATHPPKQPHIRGSFQGRFSITP
jgi:hypothetical protein